MRTALVAAVAVAATWIYLVHRYYRISEEWQERLAHASNNRYLGTWPP